VKKAPNHKSLSGYGTTHRSSYFKTYSTVPPHMIRFK